METDIWRRPQRKMTPEAQRMGTVTACPLDWPYALPHHHNLTPTMVTSPASDRKEDS